MNFTEEEKKAIVWSLKALAESDGSKSMVEAGKLAEITGEIGFKVSLSILEGINNMEHADVFAMLRSLSIEKKAYVKKKLEEVATIDGEINHLEKNALFDICYFGKL